MAKVRSRRDGARRPSQSTDGQATRLGPNYEVVTDSIRMVESIQFTRCGSTCPVGAPMTMIAP